MIPTTSGRTIWFTGLPSAGKTTIAQALAKKLLDSGYPVEILDGDVIRTYLSKDLGYSKEDRDENVRRVGMVADLLSRNGVYVLCSLVSPYRDVREEVRVRHQGRFFEVYVATPPDICAERDVKGLYQQHKAGQLQHLTGADDPYEPPLYPEVSLQAGEQTVDESVSIVWQALWLPQSNRYQRHEA